MGGPYLMIFCLLHPKQNERAIHKTIVPNCVFVK